MSNGQYCFALLTDRGCFLTQWFLGTTPTRNPFLSQLARGDQVVLEPLCTGPWLVQAAEACEENHTTIKVCQQKFQVLRRQLLNVAIKARPSATVHLNLNPLHLQADRHHWRILVPAAKQGLSLAVQGLGFRVQPVQSSTTATSEKSSFHP